MSGKSETTLIDRVAVAICESYGNEWDDSLDDSRGAPSNHPGLPGKDDWREMAKEAIAVIRQWDAGK